MKPINRFTGAAALLALLTAGPALGLPSDRDKPIRIQAHQADIDEAKGIAIYTGDVIITQGTIKITGNKVTIYRDKQGEIEKLIAFGTPKVLAHYQEKPEPEKGLMKAWGVTIEYLTQQELVHLIKKARVDQDHNTFTGDRIDYNMRSQLVNATSNNTEGPNRVEMVIQPRNKTENGSTSSTASGKKL